MSEPDEGRPSHDQDGPAPAPRGPDRDDWRRRRNEFRRRRMAAAGRDGAMGPPWAGRRGFGCLFGLLFLLVVGSLVAAMAVVVSRLGPLPGWSRSGSSWPSWSAWDGRSS